MNSKMLELLSLLAGQQELDAEVAHQDAFNKAAGVRLELNQHKSLEHSRYLDHDHMANLILKWEEELQTLKERAKVNRQKISALLIEINAEIPVPAERT